MLLTTGAIALSRKVQDEKAKRREKRQGHLSVGSSDVAKRAFASQTSNLLESGQSGINRAGTEIKFEDANDIGPDTPSSDGIYSPNAEIHDTRSSSQLDVASPVQSEKAAFESESPSVETPTSSAAWGTQSTSAGGTLEPPAYTTRPASLNASVASTMYSRDPDGSTLANSDTRSIASGSTNSRGTHSIRVKTSGPDLKSGFPYHPALFDLHVHPDKWESFQYQIIESTKFDKGDYGRMVGAATATALTGAIGTSIWVGRSMNRSIVEEKVRKGLTDETEGGLGDTLKLWNEEYFSKLGVFVHMELSESALKKPDKKSRTFRKPVLMYGSREDRNRKTEERKFVLVITRLDEEGNPMEAIKELEAADGGPVEIGSSGDTTSKIPELPGDEGNAYVELPANSPAELPAEMPTDKKKLDPPSGYVEMDSDNSHMLEKLHLEGYAEADPDAETDLQPRPLQVTPGADALNKETT